jgi:hypothetical protein
MFRGVMGAIAGAIAGFFSPIGVLGLIQTGPVSYEDVLPLEVVSIPVGTALGAWAAVAITRRVPRP